MPSSGSRLRPRKASEETFGNFAWYGAKNGQGIKILFTACKCWKGTGLPSWVPNLAAYGKDAKMVPIFLPNPNAPSPYASAGGPVWKMSIDVSGSLLVEGIWMDHILKLPRKRFLRVLGHGDFVQKQNIPVNYWWLWILKFFPRWTRRSQHSGTFDAASWTLKNLRSCIDFVGVYPTGETK